MGAIFEAESNLGIACNSVQGATALVAFRAMAA
jgi:hypothetical protein